MARPARQSAPKPAPDAQSVTEMSAADRADYIVARLEQFIRDGAKDEQGMSFGQWKHMAQSEISIAIAQAEVAQKVDELASKRVLFVSATTMVTIGFWGTVISLGKIDYMIGGIICGVAGLIMLFVVGDWRLRSWSKTREFRKRRKILERVENLTKRIRTLEKDLEAEVEELETLQKKAARRRTTLRSETP